MRSVLEDLYMGQVGFDSGQHGKTPRLSKPPAGSLTVWKNLWWY